MADGFRKPASPSLRDERLAGGVDIVVVDRQILRAPCLQPLGMFAVAVFEERPGEEGAVSHQFPSNTGRCFPTNA